MSLNFLRHACLVLIVTVIAVPGCTSSEPISYEESTSEKVATITVLNVNVGKFKDLIVKFDLEGKAEGDRLMHVEVYADPGTESSPQEVENGNLKVVYIVGKGVESVTWKEKDVPRRI